MYSSRTNLQYVILEIRIARLPVLQFLECFRIIVEGISFLAIHSFAIVHDSLLAIEGRPAVTMLGPNK